MPLATAEPCATAAEDTLPNRIVTTIVGMVPVLIGLVLAGIGVLMAARSYDLVTTGGHARGIVIKVDRTPDDDGGYFLRPTFRYPAADGITRTVMSSDQYGNIGHCPQPGDAVAVLYDPARPQDAHIRQFAVQWLLPLVLLILGILVMLPGIVIIITTLSRRDRNDPLSLESDLSQPEVSAC